MNYIHAKAALFPYLVLALEVTLMYCLPDIYTMGAVVGTSEQLVSNVLAH